MKMTMYLLYYKAKYYNPLKLCEGKRKVTGDNTPADLFKEMAD